MGYEDAKASSANVKFAYETALAAARDLWALAKQVRDHQGQRATATTTANRVWEGPKHDLFVEKMGQEGRDATAMAEGIEDTARAIARSWAAARGQQDRINKARWVDKQIDDDGWLENVGEWFSGEDDYGPPPENPGPPSPPSFQPTRSPMYPELEHVNVS
jgi:hypothetical protein